MNPVPRIGRILDLVGLLFLLVGVGVYGFAWVGFQGVPDFQRPEHGTVFAATELADGYRAMERIGIAGMLVGIAVFVVAWWVARRRQAELLGPQGDGGLDA